MLSLHAVQALLLQPIQFLRLFQLAKYWLMTVMAGTEGAKKRVWSEQSMLYGPYVSTPAPFSDCSIIPKAMCY